ncbi:ATP-binding protein [Solimonas terrae]|uniref:histidine kinase n=1 Tax=Solimonas terrae TaxID=1396819 RepID=A0A6M2BMA3_9GAMM|nr:ATP-binding protein [Solimonas terrae]NGY03524.1 HAMP domain-containing protein [Solimonas terrae]
MKSQLFWKLFALQLVAAAALLGGTLLVMSQYTTKSFSRYLEEREHDHLRQVASEIAEAYRRTHDLREAVRETDPRTRPMPPPGVGAQHLRRPPPPLTIVDRDGAMIRGEPNALVPDALVEPIVVDGELVGRVQRPPIPLGEGDVDAEFSRRQARGLYAVGGGALLLAALLAALLSTLILRPLRRLSGGVAALRQREFHTRLAVTSGDELGRLAEDFNRLAEALERYDLRQRQWLADIAHELRTPLAVLRGEIEALIDGVRRPDAANTRSLHQEVLRLQGLVDDLHLLALAESSGLHLQREACELSALVGDLVQRWQGRCSQLGFALQWQPPPRSVPVDIDAQRIEQVLVNLLENALRHAQAPGPIRVRLDVESGRVVVCVRDAGPGVPDAALSKLFDRLYRVDAARSRDRGGSGLGLAICRSIVEAHGGQIAAQRADGGGLEIRFELPLGRS